MPATITETNKFEEKAKREKAAANGDELNNADENNTNVGISEKTEDELLAEDELVDAIQQELSEAAENELLADN